MPADQLPDAVRTPVKRSTAVSVTEPASSAPEVPSVLAALRTCPGRNLIASDGLSNVTDVVATFDAPSSLPSAPPPLPKRPAPSCAPIAS
jgi:hypothetical protein